MLRPSAQPQFTASRTVSFACQNGIMTEQQQSEATPQPGETAREWIPVPPPHPYGSGQADRASGPARKGIAIASMTVGLAALLTAIVSAAYLPLFAFLAAVLGVAAVALGVVALLKKQRPAGASITGLVSGSLAFSTAIIVGILGAFTLVASIFGVVSGSDDNEAGGGQWEPGTPAESLIEWPKNMESGGMVFSFDGTLPMPHSAPPLQAGTAPVPNEVDRENGVDVLIYVDYRCPHCLSFEQANSQLLDMAVAEGATVEIVPLSFLDRVDQSTYYSSRAAGAMACIADAQPEAAWFAHHTLLSPEVQPTQDANLSNEQLIEALNQGVGGLNAAAIDCIETERFVTFAQALNSWVFATTVPNAVDPSLRVQGTPLVLVNGVPYAGDPADAASFGAFFLEQIN